jgi:hypothetical protein
MLPEHNIRFFILYDRVFDFDTKRIMKDFKKSWKMKVACSDYKQQQDQDHLTKQYILINGKNNVLISNRKKPLPKDLIEVTLNASPNISEEQKNLFISHKANIIVDYLLGQQDSALERVGFSLKTLLTLMKIDGSIGYGNISAFLYRSKEQMKSVLGIKSLESNLLYQLATNVHYTKDKGLFWIHTHGMEQFNLPDIQIRFPEEQKASYFYDLINNAALYLVENGPILKVGDTCELAGDGIVYKIIEAEKDPEHEFGQLGAIEIIQKE